MKKLLAYSLLFALTLLLVPRTWVHDCDHDHHDHSETESPDTDDDNCLVCELDMEAGTIVSLPVYNFSSNQVLKPVIQQTESLPLPSFNLYDHRGPPFTC
ncbi:MAG: hypothetical protein AB8B56_19270 [Crocinitomicaceae bacterium]